MLTNVWDNYQQIQIVIRCDFLKYISNATTKELKHIRNFYGTSPINIAKSQTYEKLLRNTSQMQMDEILAFEDKH